MNIYEKLLNMRMDFAKKNVKKSGVNRFAGYNYYELSDIMPPILELELKYKALSFVTFTPDKAILTLIDAEKPEDSIVFESPMAEASLKGAHAIQNLGAVETYQRRYLYMTAYEIVEADVLDSTQGKEDNFKKEQTTKKPTKRAVISEENSKTLNESIRLYCDLKGVTSKEAVARLEEELGIKGSEIKDEDVKRAVDIISSWLSK